MQFYGRITPEFQIQRSGNAKILLYISWIKGKKFGSKKKWQKTQTLWWQGKPIDRHSDEYQKLLDEAFETLYTTNEKAKQTLLATGDAVLTHKIGRTNPSETVLTQKEFCSRLMKIRAKLKAENFMEF